MSNSKTHPWEVRTTLLDDGSVLITAETEDSEMSYANSVIARLTEKGVVIEDWHPHDHSQETNNGNE